MPNPEPKKVSCRSSVPDDNVKARQYLQRPPLRNVSHRRTRDQQPQNDVSAGMPSNPPCRRSARISSISQNHENRNMNIETSVSIKSDHLLDAKAKKRLCSATDKSLGSERSEQQQNDDDCDRDHERPLKHFKHKEMLRDYRTSMKENFDPQICQDTLYNHTNETISHDHTFENVLDEAHHNLVRHHFNNTTYTVGISMYDTTSKGKILEVPEYVADIFQRLYNCETIHLQVPYINQQPQINEVMRAILVDWLVEVHVKFRLEQETLYLCINILDRYLASARVDRAQLQLVGVTALLLASKYEEIYPPEVKDFVYITDRAYTHQEVLDMEANILRELKFNLSLPTAYPFLQRFQFITHSTTTMKHASTYYLDRILQEHDFLKFRPSLLASATVCLAINHPEIRDHDDLESEKPGIPKVLLDYTGFSRESILDAAAFVASKVSVEFQTVSKRELIAVKRKYQVSRFNFISTDFEPPSVDDILD